MAVTEEKAQEMFLKLVVTTRELGLGWISDQVLDEINRGKEQVVRTKQRRKKRELLLTQPFGEAVEKKNKREIGIQTTEYSAQERLRLILAALERAVVHISQMEGELVEKHGSILFIPEQEEPEARIEFSKRSPSQQANVRKLQDLISRFQAEIG